MSNLIRVTFEKKSLFDLEHNVHANNLVLTTLRKQGVPVVGGIGLRGVEHGRLATYTERGTVVYEWTPGPDTPDEDDEL